MSAVIQFMGYAKWWILSKLGRKVPLVNTMGILTNCNLRCKHCSIAQNLDKDPSLNVRLSYEEIIDDLTSTGVLTHGIAVKPGKPTITGFDEVSKTVLGDL